MDVFRVERRIELAHHRLGLRNLFRFEPLPLQHVAEIGIAAEIQLVSSIEPDAALAEKIGQDAMNDGRADLALDIVADQRQLLLLEALPPLRLGGDEDRNAIDEGAARLQRLL